MVPKSNANGGRNEFYINMQRARPGDLVFSFCDTFIKAIGIVKQPAATAAKPPEFGNAGENWDQEGWRVDVEFNVLDCHKAGRSYGSFASSPSAKILATAINGKGQSGRRSSFDSRSNGERSDQIGWVTDGCGSRGLEETSLRDRDDIQDNNEISPSPSESGAGPYIAFV